jgi:hypothetical protein
LHPDLYNDPSLLKFLNLSNSGKLVPYKGTGTGSGTAGASGMLGNVGADVLNPFSTSARAGWMRLGSAGNAHGHGGLVYYENAKLSGLGRVLTLGTAGNVSVGGSGRVGLVGGVTLVAEDGKDARSYSNPI